MQYISYYTSPLGKLLLAGSETALTGVWFVNQKYYAATLQEEHTEAETPVFKETRSWLDVYFQGRDPGTLPPLSLSGSEFQGEVWEILQSIPYGSVITYGEIAARIARRRGLPHMSAQAVGGAVGRNPISILVPCHRVVGANGSLTGYAGGIHVKEALLRLEGVDFSRCSRGQ